MNVDVSVVIPTHERADLVGRAITSAFAQTARPAQVIVVDDARDAETERVVRALMQTYGPALTYLPAEPGPTAGASASRNAGVAVAAYGLIAFLDDDDWWDDRYLEQAVATRALSHADVVVTPSWMVVEGAREEWAQPSPRAFASFRPGVTGSNVLITRDAFDSVSGFDTGMWVMNDVDFFVRLRESGVSAVAAPDRLVYNEGRGDGHLTSASERRAQGLEHFLAVHGGRMDRSAVRLLKRRIHAARISHESPRLQRIRHQLGVVWFSTPADVSGTLRRRLRGRGRAH
ncbi:glycosyltransferase family 2 protein [Microbacterium sp. NPDC056044]|uniref:glycosyltransferase family 2 protein n=1 Tax=Microbacterium sp. NPDC056044 TaxID=3345690 RepID=UPI0035D5CC59